MFVFRKIWRTLFSWSTSFQIRHFALLPTSYKDRNFKKKDCWKKTSERNKELNKFSRILNKRDIEVDVSLHSYSFCMWDHKYVEPRDILVWTGVLEVGVLTAQAKLIQRMWIRAFGTGFYFPYKAIMTRFIA